MRRTSLVFLVTFLTILSFASAQPTDEDAATLAAIEKLHEEDMKATLSQDLTELANLWTEDGVRLAPGQPAVVGKEAIAAENEKWRAEHPGFQVITYVPQIKELRVVDGWAIEWGYFEGTFKMSPENPTVSFRAKLIRVLKRQDDGSWKFAHVMWNAAEPQ